MSDFTSLNTVFQKVAAQKGLQPQLQKARACFTMDEILQEMLTRKGKKVYAKATDLKKDTMTITVQSSAQAQEVQLRSMELLSQLKSKGFEIKTLRIKLADSQ